VLRVSPVFILLFVTAAVLTAFGIHKYMQQARALTGTQSFSSENPPSTIETIENIPGDWESRNKAEDSNCLNWSAEGTCLQEKE
jgi:hypothetical protein